MDVLRPDERGVTLPETLIALLLFSVVGISILSLFTHAMQLNASGLDYNALTNVAKDKLEELTSMPYSDPANPLNLAYPLAPGVHAETRPDLSLDLQWRVTEHEIVTGKTDPNDPSVFGTDRANASTVALNQGNVKLITLTVASQSALRLGRRDVTVQEIKILD